MKRKKAAVRAVRTAPSAGWVAGREAGFQTGFGHGYYLGRCQAIVAQTPVLPGPIWDIRLLFVTSGKGLPYSPLDAAVAEAFAANVREFVSTSPKTNVVALVDQVKPDLVIAMEGMEFQPDQVAAIRARGIRTAVWFTDDPYYTDVTDKLAPHYDDVFTLELNCVPFYQSLGCPRVHYLPLGVHHTVFRPQHIHTGYRKDVSFIGSGYWNRIAFFDQVGPSLAGRNLMLSGLWWDRLGTYRMLADHIRLGVWYPPDETSRHYHGSRIVINMHRSHDDDSYNMNSRKISAVSVNPRTFEIAGSGAFQLTDERLDLPQWYVPGVEIVTFNSPGDFLAKVEYYLTHEEERREIALRGLRRTLTDHTYFRRVHTMLAAIYS
ncbi:CgeB family protein [Gorillibacterium sp. sgz5001074]|uniref:CgeB family protein n=1 Tax=Gorillibacterium sp. sgz5001074 TaxID=3446695 RepID=UPI003F67B236